VTISILAIRSPLCFCLASFHQPWTGEALSTHAAVPPNASTSYSTAGLSLIPVQNETGPLFSTSAYPFPWLEPFWTPRKANLCCCFFYFVPSASLQLRLLPSIGPYQAAIQQKSLCPCSTARLVRSNLTVALFAWQMSRWDLFSLVRRCVCSPFNKWPSHSAQLPAGTVQFSDQNRPNSA